MRWGDYHLTLSCFARPPQCYRHRAEDRGHAAAFCRRLHPLDNYRQAIVLAGLSPREHTSGTNICGKVRITKMGGGLIRGKLFMCSFSAKKTNAACTALFDRLVAKGKKLALIAICNKLLK